jgi:uncharacterized membrane protein YdbT with pleckstrin-like domain
VGYIDELLLEDEVIEQELGRHWWPLFFPYTVISILLVIWLTVIATSGFLAGMPMLFLIVFVLPWAVMVTIDFFTTEYVVTSKRLFKKRGWLSRKTAEISRQKVEKVIINQGIVGRALGFGSIQFSGTGAGKVTYTAVLDPAAIKRNIAIN